MRPALCLAFFALAGCSRAPSAEPPRFVRLGELSTSAPSIETPELRLWIAKESPKSSVYLIEVTGLLGLRYELVADLSVILLSGRAELRAGPAVRELAEGDAAFIPAGLPFRMRRLGAKPARLVATFAPAPRGMTQLEDALSQRPVRR